MAIRVELPRPVLEAAIKKEIASITRAKNTSRSPEFTALYEKDLAALQHGLNTITDIK